MKALSFLCCSVLRQELTSFLADDYPKAELVFLDSMLHMRPQHLQEELNRVLQQRRGSDCILVYGDCHARMREDGRRPGCVRTDGVNCGELLLGRENYRRLRNEKAFLLLPEWTRRWREVFVQQLGFADVDLARQFLRETRNRLVYLDTGLEPLPVPFLKEIEDYFAMEVDILSVSLDNLRGAVHAAILRLRS